MCYDMLVHNNVISTSNLRVSKFFFYFIHVKHFHLIIKMNIIGDIETLDDDDDDGLKILNQLSDRHRTFDSSGVASTISHSSIRS